jgi:hypothetical protein
MVPITPTLMVWAEAAPVIRQRMARAETVWVRLFIARILAALKMATIGTCDVYSINVPVRRPAM